MVGGAVRKRRGAGAPKTAAAALLPSADGATTRALLISVAADGEIVRPVRRAGQAGEVAEVGEVEAATSAAEASADSHYILQKLHMLGT